MKTIKSKVVVFCDEGQEDWEFFKRAFTHAGITFENLTVFETPIAFEQTYSIFMFDWGGMSLGNSMLEHLIRRLYKLAEENPNKQFVLLSKFTEDAYNDMLERHEKLFNVFSVREFIDFINIKL